MYLKHLLDLALCSHWIPISTAKWHPYVNVLLCIYLILYVANGFHKCWMRNLPEQHCGLCRMRIDMPRAETLWMKPFIMRASGWGRCPQWQWWWHLWCWCRGQWKWQLKKHRNEKSSHFTITKRLITWLGWFTSVY